MVKKAGGSLVKNVDVFDVYEGEHMEKGYKSLAISITFQDENKTLVEKEISQLVDLIINELFKVLKAELRK